MSYCNRNLTVITSTKGKLPLSVSASSKGKLSLTVIANSKGKLPLTVITSSKGKLPLIVIARTCINLTVNQDFAVRGNLSVSASAWQVHHANYPEPSLRGRALSWQLNRILSSAAICPIVMLHSSEGFPI